MSVGIEDIEDIIEDSRQVLKKVNLLQYITRKHRGEKQC